MKKEDELVQLSEVGYYAYVRLLLKDIITSRSKQKPIKAFIKVITTGHTQFGFSGESQISRAITPDLILAIGSCFESKDVAIFCEKAICTITGTLYLYCSPIEWENIQNNNLDYFIREAK